MILYLDFEAYWNTKIKPKYSLKSMKTIDYIRDPQFEAHGVSLREDDGESYWIGQDELTVRLNRIDWDNVTLVCHNTYFDGLILFEKYGITPARFHDTLSMGRALFPFAPKGHSLDQLNKFLGGTGKVSGLAATNGLHTKDLPPDVLRDLAVYACNDVDITAFCYERMVGAFPEDELELMSTTLKWGCVPVVQFDVKRAKKALKDHLAERKEIIKQGGVSVGILGSNPQFAKFVQDELELTPPTKLNDDEEETWAFSKGDLQFQEFMADNPQHLSIWKARLAVKSTGTRTRLASLIHIGSTGPLPMPLKYCGAHTLRWSGGDGINPQNWERIDKEDPKKGAIRKCLVAPPGYQFIVFDQKQIELRMNMWFCGELEIMRICHDEDIYKVTAARHFNIPVDSVDSAQRFFAKQIELGLGYGMGWKRFRRECALKDIFLTEAEAYHIVTEYRASRPNVPMMQRRLNQYIMNMYAGEPIDVGPIRFVKNGIELPNDMTLSYANLEPLEDNAWRYGKPGFSKKGKSYKKKVYGGLLLENIIQSLARIVMGQNILDIHRELPFVYTVTTTHDEIAGIVKTNETDRAYAGIYEIMARTPDWATGLLLEGEGNIDERYAK